MNSENIYDAPNSDLNTRLSIENIVKYRKQIVPMWMKIFGWLFIVAGTLVPVIGVFSAISGVEGEYSLYGLEVVGSVYSPAAMFILTLFLAHGICAYGLLFGKAWGMSACLILGYLSAAICVFTMLTGDGNNIRVELIILILYLVKLHKIRPAWSGEKII